MTMIFTGVQQEPAYTQPLYGIHAKYTLSSGIELPYFLTAMDIERAIDELKIHDEVPPSLERRWSLSELFQRELDERRVTRDLVQGYLNDPSKLKFFNAMTIVLMPKTPSGELLPKFPPSDCDPSIPWNGTDPNDKPWADTNVCQRGNFGGVQYVIAGNQARLRWNPDLVHAVAVDGQHRLLALRKFREDARARALDQKEKQTHIPIIFLLLDEAAGFQHPGHSEITIRSVSRELFTDLNKNAKQVDQARQLILDDLSIEARCLRMLVTNETATDSMVELPLSLVRWQDAVNRFDQNYYVNSLVHMDLLLDTILDLKPPRSDPMDKGQVTAFIESLNESLGVENSSGKAKLVAGGRSLTDVFEGDYCDPDGEMMVPFMRLPANFLDAAVDGFKENHKGWLLRLIRDFKPYATVLQYARANDLITGDFGSFWSQTERHRKLIREAKRAVDSEWLEKNINVHIANIEKIKGRDADAQWAFKAIFQKAMVRLGRLVAFESKGADPKLGTIEDLLSVLTGLYDIGVLKVGASLPSGGDFGVWTFIATIPGGGKIKVAKATEDRILSLLSLWYYGNRMITLAHQQDPSVKFTARGLVREFEKKGSSPFWPGCDGHAKSLSAIFDTTTFHGKDAANMTEKTRKKSVLAHFSEVMAAGMLHDVSGSDDSNDGGAPSEATDAS
ncbi:MAG: hypothetical protein NTY19_28300 [Planctomycetota bacterium]|nr:hypothetical protein [Planctomycetota bacterium]